MSDIIAIALSTVALAVSIFTAWLTFFNRGSVRMTSPPMVAFGYDTRGSHDGFDPKIMIRCLIFSTGERGQVIETLFAQLHCNTTGELFPVWGVDADNKLVRGGGLWVGKTGVTAWHHFVASTNSQFQSGTYTLDVFARVHGLHHPTKLWSTMLSLPPECAPSRHDGSEQVWFDREPQTGQLQPRLESPGTHPRTNASQVSRISKKDAS